MHDWESNLGLSDLQLSIYPLSYKAINIVTVKIDFYISLQTLDQYWLTLVFIDPLLCNTLLQTH